MEHSFNSLIRLPDDIKLQTENSPIRFEEKGASPASTTQLRFEVTADSLKIYLMPSNDAIKHIRLRFRGDMRGVHAVLGDAWERCSPDNLVWKSALPHELLPWYFHAKNGDVLDSYGVRTGANSFAYWLCDASGITLLLDVRNGTRGVMPKEELLCAEVICRRGVEGEDPYTAAQEFCRMMCPAPNLPEQTVYGLNNWYWAYGNTDQTTFVNEAKYLSRLTEGCAVRPYMVMDDGWQVTHTKGYNGGPWAGCNERFSSMADTAQQVKATGCRPGIWFRPLRTMGHVPDEAIYATPYGGAGVVMDPSHPFTLERVAQDTARLAGWGYELIKHDFTTLDLFERRITDDMELRFHDRTLTNAQIVKNLYRTVQENAGGGVVIGCNTIGHIAAGIHQVQRVGDDTSGRSFEWTRRNGIHSMMRLPQNGALFQIDPDCAAFTAKVSPELNMDFMEAMAISGCTVIASITPGILDSRQEQRISDIFRLTAALRPAEHAQPIDWLRTSAPGEYLFRGSEYRYDWYRDYEGARSFITWME